MVIWWDSYALKSYDRTRKGVTISMNNNYVESYFTTTDLFLCTVISLYYPIDSINKVNPQKAIFQFKREAGVDDLVASYWARRLQIEPQTLLSQLKSIKTRLHES